MSEQDTRLADAAEQIERALLTADGGERRRKVLAALRLLLAWRGADDAASQEAAFDADAEASRHG